MSSSLKLYKVLPVYVVEDHNDALPHIYRAIGSRHLPLEGAALVHVDAHPDLLLPQSLTADEVFCKQTLFEKISIESWILPALYAGHFSSVVWIKPAWAQQIEDKTIVFDIGKDRQTGQIRLTCVESYFLSDALYSPKEKLDNCRQITLHVLTLRSDMGATKNTSLSKTKNTSLSKDLFSCSCNETTKMAAGVCTCESPEAACTDTKMAAGVCTCETPEAACTDTKMAAGVCTCETPEAACTDTKMAAGVCTCETPEAACTDTKMAAGVCTCETPEAACTDSSYLTLRGCHFVLDIDLDFFSTQNPFLSQYTSHQYSMLKQLYKYDPPAPGAEHEFTTLRKRQLDDLETIFSNFKSISECQDTRNERYTLAAELIQDIQRSSTEPIDYEMIHQAGCTCDDTELPHHVSNDGEIKQLMVTLETFLSELPKPTLVTIARSSEDEFCPPHQVNTIQSLCLSMLRSLYTECDIHLDYMQ